MCFPNEAERWDMWVKELQRHQRMAKEAQQQLLGMKFDAGTIKLKGLEYVVQSLPKVM